ncbi:hypothetical protein XELAEV_18020087mg, partial [Xenopus laevis]
MAPQYANLFMAQLEENYLASCNTRPLTYLLWAYRREIRSFGDIAKRADLSVYGHLNSHINFLDTTIYIKNGTIQTSLYQKPTGRPAYIMWNSFYPHRIKKSIVFSRALRYNRICSDDRNKHLHSLRKTFVNQGYHPQVIDDQIHRATQIPRDTLQRKVLYIGETGQKLRTSINHHRHKINTKSCDTPVGKQFCSSVSCGWT